MNSARFEPATLVRLAVVIVLGCLVSGLLVATRATADPSDGYGITVATVSTDNVTEGRSAGFNLPDLH